MVKLPCNPFIENCIRGMSELLFPPGCVICGVKGRQIQLNCCESCFAAIKYLVSPFCSCCGIPFSSAPGENHLCGQCLLEHPPYAFARGIVVYEEPVKHILHNLKYKYDSAVLPVLLKIAQGYDFSDFEGCDYFIPVPLYTKRLKMRGMNQALCLTRLMFPKKKKQILLNTLKRTRSTPPQTKLALQERRRNVRGAFHVKKPEIITDKVICLVDDVITTGSTASECSRMLIQAGAKEVRVLCMARVKMRV